MANLWPYSGTIEHSRRSPSIGAEADCRKRSILNPVCRLCVRELLSHPDNDPTQRMNELGKGARLNSYRSTAIRSLKVDSTLGPALRVGKSRCIRDPPYPVPF